MKKTLLSRLGRLVPVAASVLVLMVLAGCAAAPERLSPITWDVQEDAAIPGIRGARYWGDRPPPGIEQWLNATDDDLMRDYAGVFGVPHNYLALSGGGANGAYGAGLLVGWSEHGTRPLFTVVTGISTGALIAPFAFLGPKYDHVLRKVYTEISTDDIIEKRGVLDILRNDSLASSRPLRGLIGQYINDEMIEEMALQYRQGRSLLIGTTNLEAARPVIWDITRIASSNAPHAGNLIREVILASASIPGVFPPVIIEVESNGRRFQEIHVDGGVTSQVFMYPAVLSWKKITDKLKVPGRARLFLIRNSWTEPVFKPLERRILPIMMQSVSTLIRNQGIGDIAIIYSATRRDEVDFNLAYIPESFKSEPSESFDPEYMKELFTTGYEKARDGYPWTTGPQSSD